MTIAAGAFTVISAFVHPANCMIALCPDTTPPSGDTITFVMPLTLVTGIGLECGFTATSARAFGLSALSSLVSTVPATESISTTPIVVPASIRPGYTESPVPSITVTSAGTETFAPTAVITPLANTIVPLAIGALVTG